MNYLLPVIFIFIISCNKKEDVCTVELNKSFQLAYGKTMCMSSEPLKISFNAVEENRCPPDAICVWQGVANIKATVTINGTNYPVVLQTMKHGAYDRVVYVQGYTIQMNNLTYYPASKKEYKAELIITK